MYQFPADWPNEPPKLFDRNVHELLLAENSDSDDQLNYTDLNDFIESSDEFPIKFPIDSGRCKTLKSCVSESVLLRNINSAYPVLHENVLPLYIKYILYKRKYGSDIEKSLYKDMSFIEFVDRLLTKRAVTFMGRNEEHLLLNGVKGRGKWAFIGKKREKDPLTLENCLSYDEIKLSALLSVSSYSYLINDGSRKNEGVTAPNRSEVRDEGVIIGLIGARIKKNFFMEYQDIVIHLKQNTEQNGFGAGSIPSLPRLMASFYDKQSLTYDDFLKSHDRNNLDYFKEKSKGVYFDNITFSKRITLSIDTLLFEANHRAKERDVSAYVHVVGIGLGAWKFSGHQEEVFVETFTKRIVFLGKLLQNISDVHFAYFVYGRHKQGSKIPIQGHPKGGIEIFVAQREPHERLYDEGKLSVISYACDGNALPGNEFWSGKLTCSGDSACASSTQIAEIHNPHINRNVCARNLKIAARGKLYAFEDYVQLNRKRKFDDEASTSQ